MAENQPFRVVSFQSDVVAGHVGHAAARIAYQALHIDFLALPTVLYSNHPGHGGFRGTATPVGNLFALLDGLEERNFLDGVAAIQSGYLGEPDQADVVRDAVLRIKRRNATALYLLDPVFGDEGGAYARPGVAEAMAKHLLPLADIVTPNRFELASLTSRRIDAPADAIGAARSLGRKLVVATSIPFGEALGIVAVPANGEVVALKAARFEHAASGAGDLFAALLLGRMVKGEAIADAAAAALRSTHALIGVAGAAKDLPLVAHLDWLANPPVGSVTVSPL